MRRDASFPRITLFNITALMLWMKTYLAYKFSFDIRVDSWLQELILFINPLSFLLLVLGVSLFLTEQKRKQYLFLSSFIISFILFANILFFRFFNDFLTIPVLFQTKNMSDLGGSVTELINTSDLFYFIDLLVLGIIMKIKPEKLRKSEYSNYEKKMLITASLAIATFNLGLSEIVRPQLLTRTFDRKMLVKNIGAYNYHLYDIFLQSKTSAQRAFADSSELIEIQNYIRSKQPMPDEKMFGIAKGKNVIMVSMESMQSFVINRHVYGHEITPFLNDFIQDSFYFTDFYHQTGQGKTSDSEFIVENSLYPLGRGAVFFTHSQNEYHATPEIMKSHGYYTASLHANNKSFWNRDIMYQSFGYERFFNINDYEVNPENSVNWGLKDKPFFHQSIQHLLNMPQPFYAKLITLTNHFPFTLSPEDQTIPAYHSSSDTLNKYFPTVRYLDQALEQFIGELKTSGLYEKSIIILYGDHYGISENHNDAMSEYLGRPVTPFVSLQLQRVPLIIHIPGVKGRKISNVSGQIQVRPTIMDLIGIRGKETIEFGNSLFAENNDGLTVLRDGSFIGKDYAYTRESCYQRKSGELTDRRNCEPFIEKAKQELEYSDKIIYGDLLRFYKEIENRR
ncbi:LTA synthase family protein [Peribacillus sp. SCS-155]|uniref:LTA synthase family protein n=1 Tax=Peribacillus sedimenti TaxID=3115297 RepID=UPI003905D498